MSQSNSPTSDDYLIKRYLADCLRFDSFMGREYWRLARANIHKIERSSIRM